MSPRGLPALGLAAVLALACAAGSGNGPVRRPRGQSELATTDDLGRRLFRGRSQAARRMSGPQPAGPERAPEIGGDAEAAVSPPAARAPRSDGPVRPSDSTAGPLAKPVDPRAWLEQWGPVTLEPARTGD